MFDLKLNKQYKTINQEINKDGFNIYPSRRRANGNW